MTNPLDWLSSELDDRRAAGLLRTRRGDTTSDDAPDRLTHFGSNDYLGLAKDPRLAEAAAEAARRFGTGAGASPLVQGHHQPLAELEDALAQFEGTEAAIVFPSGYAANSGVIPALAGRILGVGRGPRLTYRLSTNETTGGTFRRPPFYIRLYQGLIGQTIRFPWVAVVVAAADLGGSYYLFNKYVTRGIVWGGRWGEETYIDINITLPGIVCCRLSSQLSKVEA